MEIKHIVFYGTLMSNGNTILHKKMGTGLGYVGSCKFPGKLYNLGRYPGLKPGSGSISHGELYKINDAGLLPLLDDYEATDNEDPSLPGFTRKPIKLLRPKLEAWIYYYDGEVKSSNLLQTGHWN